MRFVGRFQKLSIAAFSASLQIPTSAILSTYQLTALHPGYASYGLTTVTGTLLLVVEPLPSWPEVLRPQQYT